LAWLLPEKVMFRSLALIVLTCCIGTACCEENYSTQPSALIDQNWRMVKWTAERSFCGLCVEQPCESSSLLFEELLALNYDSAITTYIQFDADRIFRIKKDNQILIAGTMKLYSKNMKLFDGLTHLDLELISLSTDSLVLFTKGYQHGLADITLVFVSNKYHNAK
jgi:hypothetical protein